jgi:hypothetical protein
MLFPGNTRVRVRTPKPKQKKKKKDLVRGERVRLRAAGSTLITYMLHPSRLVWPEVFLLFFFFLLFLYLSIYPHLLFYLSLPLLLSSASSSIRLPPLNAFAFALSLSRSSVLLAVNRSLFLPVQLHPKDDHLLSASRFQTPGVMIYPRQCT